MQSFKNKLLLFQRKFHFFGSIVQMVVGLMGIIVFCVFMAQGKSIEEWWIMLLLAAACVAVGVWGLFRYRAVK